MTRRDLEFAQFRTLLTNRLAEVERMEAAEHQAAHTLDFDPQSEGQGSRLDALESQARAAEHERRCKAERARIVAALRRLESGGYGYCQACDAKIPAKRLELDPSVALCVKCAGHATHH